MKENLKQAIMTLINFYNCETTRGVIKPLWTLFNIIILFLIIILILNELHAVHGEHLELLHQVHGRQLIVHHWLHLQDYWLPVPVNG